MSPEAMRVAIAEVLDIQVLKADDGWWDLVTNGVPWEEGKGTYREKVIEQLPDYLNDLNAMHEAEKVLTEDQQTFYLDHLLPADAKRVPYYELWFFAHATAAQKAEAFLRTLGKYTP